MTKVYRIYVENIWPHISDWINTLQLGHGTIHISKSLQFGDVVPVTGDGAFGL